MYKTMRAKTNTQLQDPKKFRETYKTINYKMNKRKLSKAYIKYC